VFGDVMDTDHLIRCLEANSQARPTTAKKFDVPRHRPRKRAIQ
jgi:hypothetical protein